MCTYMEAWSTVPSRKLWWLMVAAARSPFGQRLRRLGSTLRKGFERVHFLAVPCSHVRSDFHASAGCWQTLGPNEGNLSRVWAVSGPFCPDVTRTSPSFVKMARHLAKA